MLTRRTALAGLTAIAGLGLARPGAAASLPDDADWARVVEAARKEGEVSFYSSGIARMEEPLMKLFEDRYGIKVRYARPGGGEIVVRKYETEAEAGRPQVDVMTLTDTALALYLEDKSLLAPVAVPNMGRLAPQVKADNPLIAPSGLFGLVIAYNTRMLTPERAPRSYADLANPAYKSQVLLGAPENAGSTTLLIKGWLDLYGWDFVEKLRANDVSEMRLQAEAMQAVARGEKAICVVAQSWAFTNIGQGAPVAIVWPTDGTVIADGALVVARNAPHPNAARVFLNHVLSADYQAAIVKATGIFGSAAGMTPPPGIPPLDTLKIIRPDPRQLAAQRGEMLDRWRKLMG